MADSLGDGYNSRLDIRNRHTSIEAGDPGVGRRFLTLHTLLYYLQRQESVTGALQCSTSMIAVDEHHDEHTGVNMWSHGKSVSGGDCAL